MNEKDLSKNTMEEIPEGNIEKVEEQPKNKKPLRDLLVIVLIGFPDRLTWRRRGSRCCTRDHGCSCNNCYAAVLRDTWPLICRRFGSFCRSSKPF